MERNIRHRLDQLEGEHWWFRARRQILKSIIARYVPRNAGLHLLDVGCGTGSTLRQVMKFVTVGCGATAVHVLTALTLHSLFQVAPLRANFAAFLTAVCVSYMGNWYWTFDGTSRHAFSAPRFVVVSLSCFAVNQAIVYGVVELLHQPFWLAMVPVVIIIPALGFWLNKTKVFGHADGRA